MVLDGVASQWAPVTPSVPQGSLLGPLLFTIFINDLQGETVGEVRAALYADDTKLYKNVSSVSDCLSLQTTLANLNDWSKGNNINFNTSKCKTLTVTRKKTPPDLRIHPKQQTKTCASVCGKRSRSYNYVYVVLALSHTHHHR